jgi:radical SAM superfamily enzyme YgiQ (UPF0313 family)
MKIELISPSMQGPRNLGVNFHFPQMALPVLASLTPGDIKVSVLDEMIHPLDFDEEVDLVAITLNTKTARKAYAIADEFRRRNIPVVLGGIHPNVVRGEASQHADSLVLGEAEGNWERLLKDLRYGKLKRFQKYGFFRPYVRQVIYRYLDCGILKNGFARVRCEDCGHEYLLAHSCYSYCTSFA